MMTAKRSAIMKMKFEWREEHIAESPTFCTLDCLKSKLSWDWGSPSVIEKVGDSTVESKSAIKW